MMNQIYEKNTRYPFLRVVQDKDYEWVGNRLRQDDLQEIEALGGEAVRGQSPDKILRQLVQMSELSYTIAWRDQAIGVLGVIAETVSYGIPLATLKTGRIWLLGTDQIGAIRRTLCQASPQVLDELNQRYPILHNLIQRKQQKYIQWLQWLGFKFTAPYALKPDCQVVNFARFLSAEHEQVFDWVRYS